MMGSSVRGNGAVRIFESGRAVGCGLVVHFFLTDKEMGSTKVVGEIKQSGQKQLVSYAKRAPL
jgi:hypothetical protein